ncbi:MAG: cardiolipin synthase [Eubacteriales bacterium]|nr:cardiolipin synthase [Eubacteriales bacterium]
MSTRSKAKTHKKSWPILSFLFSRMTFFVVFLAIQIYILWAAFTFLDEKLAFSFFIFLSGAEILFILNQEGSSSFKIAWIFPIMIFPVFGALFYLFIQLQTTVKRMRHRLDIEVEDSEDCMKTSATVMEQVKGEDRELKSIVSYLDGECQFPCYDNTSVQFFPMGEDFFPVFIEELKKAKKFIFMEFFIVAEGEIWGSILEVLKEKAKEGVQIKFMYDGTNSIKNLPFWYADKLKSYGIDAKVFSPVRPAISSYQNNRDHRKICVVDGTTAFTGGLNLADEYANIEIRFGVWKDTAAMFKGEAANSFTMLFLQMWNSSYRDMNTKEVRLPFPKYKYDPKYDRRDDTCKREGYVIPYGDNPLDSENVGENVYLSIINEARDYVHIMTPYLILDDQTIHALCFAAKRGVDVKIIFPHIPDKPYAFWLGHSYYEELIKNGVRIFEFEPGFVHAKEFISDGRKAVIGTINLDFRSLYLHFENACYLYKSPAIGDMETDFEECLKKCIEIDMEAFSKMPPLKMLYGKLLRVLAPLF